MKKFFNLLNGFYETFDNEDFRIEIETKQGYYYTIYRNGNNTFKVDALLDDIIQESWYLENINTIKDLAQKISKLVKGKKFVIFEP